MISLLGVLSYILQDNLQYGILSCKVNPDVLANLIGLAEFYQSQGRYSEAESLHIQVLEQRKRLLGDDHPDVAISFNNLGFFYQSQGRYEEAEPLLIKALELRKRLLGDDHPEVISYCSDLIQCYRDQGHEKEAEILLKRRVFDSLKPNQNKL
ncbi:MAG: tetratricopeptide repeat protein [Cyanothece sp. SIO1E1]|nr:tetratricopeptide repeat protein [Cyanothece sp. SIO1E1]